MNVHLSQYDVAALIKGARTSIQISDEGESFYEEALGCFEEDELETLENEYGADLEDFFVDIFEKWDDDEAEELPLLLMDALAELDIEMTFDEPEDFDEVEWNDDLDEPIDDLDVY